MDTYIMGNGKITVEMDGEFMKTDSSDISMPEHGNKTKEVVSENS